MDKLITQQLSLKNINPNLAKAIAKEHGIKEEEVQLIRKGLTPSDVKFEEGERAAISYITTKEVDRDGEIVDPKGAMLKDYRKNPVVLFGHDYRSLPIGKNEWIKSDEKGLIAKTVYADHAEADKVYQYRKAGFPLAESIGFVPIKFRDFNEEERKANGGARRIYDKWVLLEYSDVAVPSNPGAQQIAVSKGLMDIKPVVDEFEVKADDIINYNDETLDKTWEDKASEVRFLIRNLDLFQSDSFRRLPIKRTSKKIYGIAGKLTGETSMTLQSLSFSKSDEWTLDIAKEWVSANSDLKTMALKDILMKMLEDEDQVAKVSEEFERAQKEGRVLSQKNRSLIKECVEVLNKLIAATEAEKPAPKNLEIDKKKRYNDKLNALMNDVSDVLKKLE